MGSTATLFALGTLTLNNTNTYTGTTTVNTGIMSVTNGASMGTAAVVETGNGGSLLVGGGSSVTIANPLTLNGAAALGGTAGVGLRVTGGGQFYVTGAVSLAGATLIEADSNGTPSQINFNNTVSGVGLLVKTGAGDLQLNGTSTQPDSYTGGIVVDAGVLTLNDAGGGTGTGSVTIGNGAGIQNADGSTNGISKAATLRMGPQANSPQFAASVTLTIADTGFLDMSQTPARRPSAVSCSTSARPPAPRSQPVPVFWRSRAPRRSIRSAPPTAAHRRLR